MEMLVETGQVTQLGISNLYDLQTFQMLYNQSRIKPRVLQNRFYASTGYDAGLRKFCVDNGVAYQSFWTLTANSHVLNGEDLARVALRVGMSTPQVLFRWLIQS